MPSQWQVAEQTTRTELQPVQNLLHEDSCLPVPSQDNSRENGHHNDAQLGRYPENRETAQNSEQRLNVILNKEKGKDSLERDALRLWNSLWLHWGVLIGLLAIFTALFAAIIVLYYIAKARHGFTTSISLNRYSWTYSPTACRFPTYSRYSCG